MSEKTCVCGRSLGLVSRHDLCFVCRDERQKRKEKQKRIDARTVKALADGEAFVHSCFYGTGQFDPFVVERCNCKKLVHAITAKNMVSCGDAFNFDAAHRGLREWTGGAIVLRKPFVAPPMSTIGARIAIERHVGKKREKHVNQTEFDLDMQDIAQEAARRQEIIRMQAIVREDVEWRKVERECKLDVEAELSREAWAKLTVFVDSATFDIDQKESYGRPGILASELRSSFGSDVAAEMSWSQGWSYSEPTSIGRDVGPGLSTIAQAIDNFEDPDCQPPGFDVANDPNTETEVEESGDPEDDTDLFLPIDVPSPRSHRAGVV